MADYLTHLDHGITLIDTGFVRSRFDASYLIVEKGRGAFIDTGTNFTLPRLLAALAESGLTKDTVDWVVVTHVHLDHAGGAGLLMQQLPLAKLVAHPRAVRHLADPSALLEGARAVYGAEALARQYGEVQCVPEDRIVATQDGLVLELAGRALRFLDTPGHAKHHHCVWDQTSRGFFTGDSFGLSYPDLNTPAGPFVFPATAPVQFDPPALKDSISRMLAANPEVLYLTHFGPVRDIKRAASLFMELMEKMVDSALSLAEAPHRLEELKLALLALYSNKLREHGWDGGEEALGALLSLDVELNAQGLGVWLDKQSAAK